MTERLSRTNKVCQTNDFKSILHFVFILNDISVLIVEILDWNLSLIKFEAQFEELQEYFEK